MWGEGQNSEMRTASQRKHFFWCFLAPKTPSSPFSTQLWGTAPLSCVRHRFIEFQVTFSVFSVFIVLKHIFNPNFKQLAQFFPTFRSIISLFDFAQVQGKRRKKVEELR